MKLTREKMYDEDENGAQDEIPESLNSKKMGEKSERNIQGMLRCGH